MSSKRKFYETPELVKHGSIAELTKESGWGLQELFASIITAVQGGPTDISIGQCDGSCFS